MGGRGRQLGLWDSPSPGLGEGGPLIGSQSAAPRRKGRGPGWSHCGPGLSFSIRSELEAVSCPTARRGPTPPPGGRARPCGPQPGTGLTEGAGPGRRRSLADRGQLSALPQRRDSRVWVSTHEQSTPLSTRHVAAAEPFPFWVSVSAVKERQSCPAHACGHSAAPSGSSSPAFLTHAGSPRG